MLGNLAKKIFGSANDRRLKTYRPAVAAINALEPELAALSDEALRARTDDFRAQLASWQEPRRSAGSRFRHRARSRQARLSASAISTSS